jgi:nucleoid DNA-binding protein
MEYQELVTVLAERTHYTRREIRQILRLLVKTIRETLEDGRDVHIYGLGRFQNLEARARSGRHPITGERIPIPARRRIKFEPIDEFRDAVRASAELFKKESLEARFGLPRKEDRHGKVWRGDRSGKSAKGKEGRKRG